MIFDRYVRLDIGPKFFSKLRSEPDFLSKGSIIACFISSGKTPDSRVIFTISVMTGSRTSKYSFSSHVGTGSDDNFPNFVNGCWCERSHGALVSFSTCLDVISGDLGLFKSGFLRILEILSTKYSLNLSARSISESQSVSSVFFFRWRISSTTLNSAC